MSLVSRSSIRSERNLVFYLARPAADGTDCEHRTRVRRFSSRLRARASPGINGRGRGKGRKEICTLSDSRCWSGEWGSVLHANAKWSSITLSRLQIQGVIVHSNSFTSSVPHLALFFASLFVTVRCQRDGAQRARYERRG